MKTLQITDWAQVTVQDTVQATPEFETLMRQWNHTPLAAGNYHYMCKQFAENDEIMSRLKELGVVSFIRHGQEFIVK